MSGAEPFLIAAALASAAGSAVEGVNAYQTGAYQKKLAEQQSADVARAASSEAQLALEEGARGIGRGAVIAAKGGGLNGSALDVLGDLSRQSMYEARRATAEGQAEASAIMAEGRQAKQQGALTALSKGLEAASTAMSAGMKLNERRVQARTRSSTPGPKPGSGALGYTGASMQGLY